MIQTSWSSGCIYEPYLSGLQKLTDHGNIIQMVQVAENTALMKPGNPGNKYKANMLITAFEITEKAFENSFAVFDRFRVIHDIRQRLSIIRRPVPHNGGRYSYVP